MKALLVCALLALLVGQSLASLTGLYSFTSTITEGVSSKPYLRLASKVLVSPVAGEEQYSLKIVELALSVNEEDVPVQSLDLPFQFIRSTDGLIRTVLVHPEESLDTKNLKKFITESFQVSLSPRPTEVEEAGFNGVRNVHYTNVYADAKRVMKKGTYTLSDFVSFPAGSNMEKSITSIISKKMTSMNAQDKSLISAKTTFEIVSLKDTKDIKFITESSLQFETAEIQTIQVVDEVAWKSETLLHELDSKVRIATLKSQFPSVATLAAQVQENGSKATMARGKLVWLMNNDEESLQQGLELLSKALASPLDKQARVLSTLARVRSAQAQEILVQEITNAAGDATKLKLILKSLVSLDHPESASLLVSTLQKIQVPAGLQPLVDLTIGHITKYLPAAEASEVLVAFINQLALAQEEPEKIQLLHILGNAGENAPLSVITTYLADPSAVVRAAALTNLRSHLQLEAVQEKVVSLLSNQESLTQGILNSFLAALKENSKKHNALNDRFASFLSSLVAHAPKNEAVSNLKSFLESRGIAVKSYSVAPMKSESEIWNDTSDPIFNLVAPVAQRDEDVLRYPDNSAYIFGSQFGPRFANLKVAGGVFSGTNGNGCLAGNFKIFDKLYTDVEVLGDVTVLADLQLYVLTFGGKFDSRIYAIINGNTVIDIILSSECSEEDIPIFDGDISIVDYETEFPVGPANGVAFIQVSAGLNFAAGYKICLLVLAPYVEIFLTGQVDLTASAGVTITALGLVRGGLEADAYLNYIVGPDTQLGSRNSSAGIVCQACIGVYYGYQDQTVYTGLWFQRREGLSWGEKQAIPLLEYVYPAVPFPTPLVETCSETAMEAEPSKEGILKH